MDQKLSSTVDQNVKVAYLLSFPVGLDSGDKHDMGRNVKRFGSLNEAYEYITTEHLEKFTIEKIVKTLVAERL
jgi:hypothetical protein